MRNSFKFLIAGVLLAFGTVANATTTTVPDFNLDFVGLSGGDLSGVTDTSAIGIDINIDVLQVSGADGQLPGAVLDVDIQGGKLNFNTAAGTFNIIGGITDLGISDVNTVLFTSAQYDWTFTSNPFMDVFTASGTGFAGDDLLLALNEPLSANPFAFGGFSLQSEDGVINSTDFLATSLGDRTPEVPIPAAAWLFGSGLLGLVGVARRKPA